MSYPLQFHPLANIFPLLDGDEFSMLVEDIRTHGLREPIMLFEGAILDGRNRYRACIRAGIDPRFEIYNGNDPLSYVISLNLKRRHLDESPRAMVAAKITNMRQGERTDLASIEARSVSQSAAAHMMYVSRASVQRAAEVRDHAVPELAERVERGQVSVSAAASVAQLPESEQREIVARGEKEILAAAKEINARRWEGRKSAAIAKTTAVEFKAQELGKFAVIYADPPWRYENRQ